MTAAIFHGMIRLPVETESQLLTAQPILEPLYTPQQIAIRWSVSPDTVTRWFVDEDGVLDFGRGETLHTKRYKLLRIPHSVLVRVESKRCKR